MKERPSHNIKSGARICRGVTKMTLIATASRLIVLHGRSRNVSPMGSSNGREGDGETPDESAGDWTPPVMWPESGSGFEADPFSPAGMSQQLWHATGRRPRSRLGLWTVRIVCVVIALAFIAAQVVH